MLLPGLTDMTPQDATEALARALLDAEDQIEYEPGSRPPFEVRVQAALAADGWSVTAAAELERLRAAALDLCRFAGRFSAGDIDVERGDVQVAIDEVRIALGEPS